MFYSVKKFFKKIHKICEYMPVLWKDEDWDFDYLLELIEFKAKRMSKCIKEDNIIVEDSVREIEEQVAELCEHLANYRNINRIVQAPFEVEHLPVENENGTTSFIAQRKDTKTWTEEDEKAWHAYIKETIGKEQEEWHNFWQTLDKYAQGWWD